MLKKWLEKLNPSPELIRLEAAVQARDKLLDDINELELIDEKHRRHFDSLREVGDPRADQAENLTKFLKGLQLGFLKMRAELVMSELRDALDAYDQSKKR